MQYRWAVRYDHVHSFCNNLCYQRRDLSRVAFRCADPADVDATYKRIIDAGFEGKREPWEAFWGERFAYLRDPDGNPVALFAPLEQPTP